MFKPVLFSLAIAVTSLASTASAFNHEIIIEEGGFFPEITYLQPGDNAIIVNGSEYSASVEASDQSWTSKSLSPNEHFVLSISDETVLTFNILGDAEKTGYMSFSLPPLEGSDDIGTVGVTTATD